MYTRSKLRRGVNQKIDLQPVEAARRRHVAAIARLYETLDGAERAAAVVQAETEYHTDVASIRASRSGGRRS